MFTTNKLNERNLEYKLIETNRGIESLCNCWQHPLKPAIQKFAGIVHQNPLICGKVKDDIKLDPHYPLMREEYVVCVYTCRKDMPMTFSKHMKAYHFLSQHTKFEV